MSIRQHQVNIHGQIAYCSLSQSPEVLKKLEMRSNALEGNETYRYRYPIITLPYRNYPIVTLSMFETLNLEEPLP